MACFVPTVRFLFTAINLLSALSCLSLVFATGVMISPFCHSLYPDVQYVPLTPLYCLLAAGCVGSFLSILACVAVAKGSRCLVNTYLTLVSLLLASQLTLVGVYFGAGDAFGRTTSKFFMNGIWQYGRGNAANDQMIDDMQVLLRCCSVYNILEWTLSANGTVPASCCPMFTGENNYACPEIARYDTKCATALDQVLRENATEIGGSAIALMAAEAVVILAAALISRSLEKGKRYKVYH